METIDILAAESAITKQIKKYGISMDLIDRELGYSLFAKDSYYDCGEFYTGEGKGFIDKICMVHPNREAMFHYMTNIIIEVDSETSARSSTYGFVVARTLPDQSGNQYVVHSNARYLDEWVKEDGVWKILRRTAKLQIGNMVPLSVSWPLDYVERDKSNMFYELFPEFKL